MPNIKSAKKKMRKDVRRTKQNNTYRKSIQQGLKEVSKLKGKEGSAEKAKKVISLIDKAAKKKVIQKNKAARLKSRVMKLGSKKK